MNYPTLFPNILVLYSGWIPLLLALIKKRTSFLVCTMCIMLTQILFCIIIIKNFDFLYTLSLFNIIIGFVGGILIFILEYSISILTKKNINKNIKKLQVNFTFSSIIIIMPIIEEIYFRELIYTLVNSSNIEFINKDIVFILLSGFVVLINHYQAFKNRTIFLQKLLIEGFFISSLFVFTKSIWVTIIAHIIFNIINLVKYYEIGGVAIETNTN